MKKIILLFLFLLSVFTLFADQSQKIELARDEEDYLQKLGEVTMCVDPDWPPYEQAFNKNYNKTANPRCTCN